MERKATRSFGSRKIVEALGVPLSTTQRWLQRLRSDGDMASRNVGRPRGAEAGLCVWCSLHVSSHICRIASDLCIFSIIRNAFVPHRDCSRAVLHSRQCSQTSARVWHRAQPPWCPEADESGALASEASEMWVKHVNLLCYFHISGTLLGEEPALDGAEQAAPPGMVQIDTGTARRDEEAVGSISQDMQDTL